MNIGQRIKTRREAIGLSQDDLAIKTGYKSRSSINKIELDGRGLPQSKIMAFADALQTTPAYLMGWDEEKAEDKIYYVSEDKKDVISALDELSADDLKIVMDMIKRLKH